MKTDQYLLALMIFCFVGCANTTPPKIYVPSQDSETMSFYRNGVPIGSVNMDSSFIMVSLQPDELTHRKYMRLWLLYKNNSNSAYLLEPLKTAKLSIRGEKDSYDDISPESPTQILAHIENEKATSMIFQAIGGALESMSAQPTTITNTKGEEWKVNDKSAKVESITNRTAASMASTAALYDIFKNSINSGILRRNTVFPGESVNGYIYFRLPTRKTNFNDNIAVDPSKYKYTLYVVNQSGNTIIEFTPSEGE